MCTAGILVKNISRLEIPAFCLLSLRLDCFVEVNLKTQHKLGEIHKNIISNEEAASETFLRK